MSQKVPPRPGTCHPIIGSADMYDQGTIFVSPMHRTMRTEQRFRCNIFQSLVHFHYSSIKEYLNRGMYNKWCFNQKLESCPPKFNHNTFPNSNNFSGCVLAFLAAISPTKDNRVSTLTSKSAMVNQTPSLQPPLFQAIIDSTDKLCFIWHSHAGSFISRRYFITVNISITSYIELNPTDLGMYYLSFLVRRPKNGVLCAGVVPIVLYCNTIAKYCNTLVLQH